MDPEPNVQIRRPPEGDIYEKLRPELFPSEQMLWFGRPEQGLRFTKSSAWVFALGFFFVVIITVLALLVFGVIPMPKDWDVGSTHSQNIVACVIWIVLLAPLAFFCLGGYHWMDSSLRARLFYGLTNERVLILRERANGAQSLISLRLRDIPHMTLLVNQDGTGAIAFQALPVNASSQNVGYSISFRLIPEVRQVYARIRSAQKEAA